MNMTLNNAPPAALRFAGAGHQRRRAGNTGVEGVWHFDSGKPGRNVMVSALVHGNELCGAWALKGLLEAGVRPEQGSLTLAFCNLAAFDRFDAAHHDASRFVDQDLNRQWLDERMDAGDSSERRRAAALRPLCSGPTGCSTSTPCTSLRRRCCSRACSRATWRWRGPCARPSTSWWTPGTKTACACATTAVSVCRMTRRATPFAADRVRLPWRPGQPAGGPGPVRALHRTVGVISAAALAQQLPGWRLPDAPRHGRWKLTQPVVARSAAFRFVEPFTGLECIEKQGTVIGDNDGEPVLTRTTIACW